MGAIEDAIRLAIILKERMKDRRDIEGIKRIHALLSSVQSSHGEVAERNKSLEQEIAGLKQQLKELRAEEVRINRGIEFRCSKRTNNLWMGFCPRCHSPAQEFTQENGGIGAICTAECGWQVLLPLTFTRLEDVAYEMY